MADMRSPPSAHASTRLDGSTSGLLSQLHRTYDRPLAATGAALAASWTGAAVAAADEAAAGELTEAAAVELATDLVTAAGPAACVVGEQADAARPTPRPSAEIVKTGVMWVKCPKLIVCSSFSSVEGDQTYMETPMRGFGCGFS
jgi:hypothetical protein